MIGVKEPTGLIGARQRGLLRCVSSPFAAFAASLLPCGGGRRRCWVWVRVRPAGVGPARVGVGAWLGRRPRAGRWCVFRWCPTLPLPGGGSTIGAGGLSFRVRYGSGRFPARCGRRDGGGVVVRGPWWPAPVWGVGWVGSGLRSGRGVWGRRPPRRARALVRVRGRVGVCGSCRPISTGRLSPLPGLHLRPIDPVVHWGPSTTPGGLCGDLVLEVVSRLDAFSGYPSRTWPTSGAPGGTTGAPEVRPSRSSRTGDGSPQVSCARRG